MPRALGGRAQILALHQVRVHGMTYVAHGDQMLDGDLAGGGVDRHLHSHRADLPERGQHRGGAVAADHPNTHHLTGVSTEPLPDHLGRGETCAGVLHHRSGISRTRPPLACAAAAHTRDRPQCRRCRRRGGGDRRERPRRRRGCWRNRRPWHAARPTGRCRRLARPDRRRWWCGWRLWSTRTG